MFGEENPKMRQSDEVKALKNRISELEKESVEIASGFSEALNKLRAIFDILPDGLVVLNREGEIIYANGSAAANLGFNREEFLSLNVFDIDTAESKSKYYEHFEDILNGKRLKYESIHKKKDGTILYVNVLASVFSIQGEPVTYNVWHYHGVEENVKFDVEKMRADIEAPLNAKIKSLEDALAKNIQSQVPEREAAKEKEILNKDIERFKKILDEKEFELSSLRSAFANEKNELLRLIALSQENAKRFEEECVSNRARIQELADKVALESAEREKYVGELNDSRGNYSGLINEKNNEIERLKKQMEVLSHEKNSEINALKEAKVNANENIVKVKDAGNEGLRTRLALAEKKVIELDALLAQKDADIETIRSERDVAVKNISRRVKEQTDKESMGSLDWTVKEQSMKISELTTKLADEIARRKGIEDKLRKANDKINELTEEEHNNERRITAKPEEKFTEVNTPQEKIERSKELISNLEKEYIEKIDALNKKLMKDQPESVPPKPEPEVPIDEPESEVKEGPGLGKLIKILKSRK